MVQFLFEDPICEKLGDFSPVFLYYCQLLHVMIVDIHDLMPAIAPVFRSIFGCVALIPTQRKLYVLRLNNVIAVFLFFFVLNHEAVLQWDRIAKLHVFATVEF